MTKQSGNIQDGMDLLLYAGAACAGEKEADGFCGAEPEDALSEKADKRIYRRLRKRIAYCEKHEHYSPVMENLKRAAVIVLAVLSVSFAGAFSIKAVRAGIYSAIIEWYTEYIAVAYDVDGAPPAYIETKKEPSAIPAGWTHTVMVDSISMYFIQYSLDNEDIMAFRQKVLDDAEDLIDNDNSVMESVMVQGREGILITLLDKGWTYLLWNDGEYAYTIDYRTEKMDRDAVLEIAASLR